ncbi:protein of unknown function [Ruminococcaceae bacterium BL-6]|nr:protein of unknown function [Ruminococcaceae bacterium BL-6]
MMRKALTTGGTAEVTAEIGRRHDAEVDFSHRQPDTGLQKAGGYRAQVQI